MKSYRNPHRKHRRRWWAFLPTLLLFVGFLSVPDASAAQGAPAPSPASPDLQPSSKAEAAPPPRLTVTEPVSGATVSSTTPLIAVSYSDLASGIDPNTFKAEINGVDQTQFFSVAAGGASFRVPSTTPLPEGQNVIKVSISNKEGQAATAISTFTIRRKPAEKKEVEQSPIEMAFSQPIPAQVFGSAPLPEPLSISRDLTQFGYDLFKAPSSTFAPVSDVPVGPLYVLGPGDTLVVNIYGKVESNAVLPINRRGEVFIPKVGPVRVWGLTLARAEALIRSELSNYFTGFQADVTLGELRTINVLVVGEVAKPGAYTLSSLSTVSNALYIAGGPTKHGSLRSVQLVRNHDVAGEVDIYGLLLNGARGRDYPLESGDKIFVPPVGPVVAIAGSVKRPGIYELKGPTRIVDFIEMAGGIIPSGHLRRVQIERVQAHAEKVMLDLDLSRYYQEKDESVNIPLKDGDFIKIFSIDARVYNSVSLEGFVKRPSSYELKPGMRLSDLVTPEEILPEAYLERVEIVRIRPDFTREVLSASLARLLQGDRTQDLALRSLDRIIVRSEFSEPGTVTLKGEVRRPGKYAITKGERLSSVLKRAGGFTEKAYLPGAIFTRESARKVEREQLEEFIRAQERRLLAEASAVVVSGVEKEEVAVQQQTLSQRRELLRALATKVTLGRVVIKLDDLGRLEGSPTDVLLEDGDTLTVPQKPSAVLVLGSVRNPTSILHKEGEGVEYYLNRAGGLTREADKKEIHIVKADGSAVSNFTMLRTVEPGDTIIVPPMAEVRVRLLPVTRDIITIIGQTALTIAALAVIF